MSAVILNLADYRQQRRPVLASPTQPRVDVAAEVRGYCELLGLTLEQTGLCSAVAVQRFQNGGDPKNAVAAGKDRADRIFRAGWKPPTGPAAA